jgi:glucose-1-phosphate thymidylyltransferase
MKGIILAGGTGSRLFPLTKVINKHLLPVGRHLMIEYPITKMKQCGIKDIMIITGSDNMGDMVKLLGSGHEYGVNFTFRVQDGALGIAHALGLCEDFVGKDKCLVILGDNIFLDNIKIYTDKFEKQTYGAKVLLKKVSDPYGYGIADMFEDKIIGIEEKPKKPKSDYCVTGIYMYDNEVFDVIKTLKPSQRQELEITDVNNWYVKEGTLSYDMLEHFWIDAGTFESYFYANNIAQDLNIDDIL